MLTKLPDLQISVESGLGAFESYQISDSEHNFDLLQKPKLGQNIRYLLHAEPVLPDDEVSQIYFVNAANQFRLKLLRLVVAMGGYIMLEYALPAFSAEPSHKGARIYFVVYVLGSAPDPLAPIATGVDCAIDAVLSQMLHFNKGATPFAANIVDLALFLYVRLHV